MKKSVLLAILAVFACITLAFASGAGAVSKEKTEKNMMMDHSETMAHDSGSMQASEMMEEDAHMAEEAGSMMDSESMQNKEIKYHSGKMAHDSGSMQASEMMEEDEHMAEGAGSMMGSGMMKEGKESKAKEASSY